MARGRWENVRIVQGSALHEMHQSRLREGRFPELLHKEADRIVAAVLVRMGLNDLADEYRKAISGTEVICSSRHS